MNSAIFLDRDGVIIENRDEYVRSWEDVAFLPGALTSLARLAKSPYKIIMITNQSAVGRKIISFETAFEINHRIVKVITKAGGRIDGVYLCPHAPDDHCLCRKPLPGLLLQAQDEHQIDFLSSCLIGDAISDLQAAYSAGIPNRILVRTGRGEAQLQLPAIASLPPFQVFPDLASAINFLLTDLLPHP